ncbi:hypothetical protein MYG64_07260 [Ensifer adhaerens]|uniref:hypothetical protein n=1 Tax=Ensifer adhaerens TaxID=106592 RepID=UPI0021010502|nr:hypothetical protein [Ensifer adhaerens]UTV38083.1 hypothetical protein MYG64_07260 [Ensifer adhaerens]
MWDAIAYVGGGLSLVAFIVAALQQAYSLKLRSTRKNLTTVPERDRVKAMEIAEQYVHIDPNVLSQAKRYEIIKEQIRLKEQRQWQVTIIALVVAILLAGVSFAAIFQSDQTPAVVKAGPTEFTVCNVDLDNSDKCPPNDFLERIGHSADDHDIANIAASRCSQKGLRPSTPAGYMKSDTSGGAWGVNVIVIRCEP